MKKKKKNIHPAIQYTRNMHYVCAHMYLCVCMLAWQVSERPSVCVCETASAEIKLVLH